MGKIPKILFSGGYLLVLGMIVHILVAWIDHNNTVGNSAPASVNLVLALYYILPIALLFVAGHLLNKRTISS